MSQVYDMRLRIEEKIKADGLNVLETKGKLALKTGKMLALITPTTPDDPDLVSKLRDAAKEVLNLSL